MKISKEVKVGVLAVIAIAMFVIGYNYLKGQNLFASTNKYYGVYKNIDNLLESNPVVINGYKVGHVSNVNFNNKTLELTVEITVQQSIEVPMNSVMKIINNDLIGSKAVELVLGDSAVLANDGQYLTTQRDESFSQAVADVINPLTKRINSVLQGIDTAVSGADLETTLIDASLALRSFKETADKLNKLLDGKDDHITAILNNIEATSKDLRGISPKIDSIVDQLELTSAELAKIEFSETVEKINTLVLELNKTTQAINNSEGSLGKLVNEDELYEHLDSTILQLHSLLLDIEKYPSRYTGVWQRQRKKANKEKEKAEQSQ